MSSAAYVLNPEYMKFAPVQSMTCVYTLWKIQQLGTFRLIVQPDAEKIKKTFKKNNILCVVDNKTGLYNYIY